MFYYWCLVYQPQNGHLITVYFVNSELLNTRNLGRYAPLFLGGLRPPGGPSAPTGWASPTLRPTAPVVVKNFQIGAFGPNLEIFHGQTNKQTNRRNTTLYI